MVATPSTIGDYDEGSKHEGGALRRRGKQTAPCIIKYGATKRNIRQLPGKDKADPLMGSTLGENIETHRGIYNPLIGSARREGIETH